jgi:hypothetical protein
VAAGSRTEPRRNLDRFLTTRGSRALTLGLRTGTPAMAACYGLALAATLVAAALVLSIG